MKIIGLTGGIGSGKSTVSQYLKKLGAVIVDADKVAHEAYLPDKAAWHDIVATFGEEVVAANREIDRKKLGAIVFSNPESLTQLNRILHPRMHDMMKSQIEEYRMQGVAVMVIEAAVLIEAEADWMELVDEVWVTVAPETAVIERLKKQRGQDKEQTLARIRSQLSPAERGKYADVVINNDGDLEALKARVRELWDKLCQD